MFQCILKIMALNTKNRLFLVVLFLLNISCSAQDQLNISAQGGVSWSIPRTKNHDTVQPILGIAYGISLDGYKNRFSYGVDFIYKQVGFKLPKNYYSQLAVNPTETAVSRYTLNYFSIPVKFWYNIPIGPAGYRGFYGGFVGVSPSFFLSGKQQVSVLNENENVITENTSELLLLPNRFYLAVNFGVKMVYPIDEKRFGKWYMGIYSHLDWGLQPITSDQFFPTGTLKLFEGQLRFVVQYRLK